MGIHHDKDIDAASAFTISRIEPNLMIYLMSLSFKLSFLAFELMEAFIEARGDRDA